MATQLRRQPPPGSAETERFLQRLSLMGRVQRVRAARSGAFSRGERALWAARYPDEVPRVNGEFEWIALGLADLD